ncbi:translocation/assembly module TamB domain-containing protein [Burkholderiaceae bacterium UC74_6]
MKIWKRSLWFAAPLPLFAALGLAVALPFTEAGSAWLLRHIPGVQAEAPQGALLGDFAARRVDLQFGADHIRIDGLRWSAPHLGWKSLAFDRLSADEVALELTPSKTKAQAPADLLMPLELSISHLQLARLRQGTLLLQEIEGRLSLGNAEHSAELTHLRWEKLELSGQARIATQGEMKVQAQLQARDASWSGQADLNGPLSTLGLQAKLEQSGQQLQLSGQLQPFAPWPLHAVQARAESLDLQALSNNLPKTQLSGSATIDATGWDQPAKLDARLSNAAAGRWDQQALPVQSLTLRAQARPDQWQSLQIEHFEARLGSSKAPAGSISGQGRLEAGQRFRVQAQFTDIRPERIDGRAAPMLLAGNADLAGAPGQPLTLTGHLSGKQATLDLAAQIAGEKITVSRAELVSGSAQANLKGEAELLGAGWRLNAEAQLRELDPHAFWNDIASTKLSGQGRADLRTGGADQWPQGDATLELKGLLSGTARYSSGDFQSRLALQSNTLETSGRLSGKPSSPQLTLNSQLKAPKLYEFNALLDLLGSKQRLAGSAEGRLQANGASVDGQLQLTDVQLAGQTLKNARLELKGTLDNHRAKLDASGLLHRPGQPPSQALAGEVHAQLEGSWQAKRWTGRHVSLNARPTDTRLPAMLAVEDLALTLDFSAARELLAARAEPGSVELGGARWRWNRLEWQAPRAANALPEIHASLTLDTLAVGPLLARWQSDFGWGGDLRVAGHVRLDTRDRVDIEALIERQSGDLTVTDEQKRSRALGLNAARLSLTAQNGEWRFTPELSGTGWGELTGNIVVKSDALVPAANAPLSGQLKIQVAELGGWGALLPAGWRLGGRLESAVDLGGTLGAAHLSGNARGSGLSARHMLMGVNLDQGSFEMAFDGDTARVQSLTFRGGEGHIEASGEARLGEFPRALVSLKAEHFTVFQRVDRSLVLSGQASANLTPQELQLEGQMRADSGLFDFTRAGAPTLGDDVEILRPLAERNATATSATPGAPTGSAAEPRKVYVRLAVDLGDQLKLRGRGLETRLAGQLELTQQAGPPRLKGTVRTIGGTYAAYGQKLEVERGEVIFNGAYDNPRLDILAVRPDTDTRVGVLVTGTALAPRIQLYSEPDMSDGDKLSWLLLGRGPEELGRADTALLQRAALALLAGEGEGDTSKLIKRLGLDDISVRQSELTGSEGEARETIVHIGRQLSRNWYVAYERSLNATTGSWQLIYRIARRFTLRMQTGEDNALDLIWQWRW